MTIHSKKLSMAVVSVLTVASPAMALAQGATPGTTPGTAPATAPATAAPMTASPTRPPAPAAGLAPGAGMPTDAKRSNMGNPTYATSDSQTRASKIIGASVYNEQRQKIGTISELLISNGHDVGNAVLSVGGFLGIASKLVLVPYDQIKMHDNRLTMPGATKDALKQMPAYKYATASS